MLEFLRNARPGRAIATAILAAALTACSSQTELLNSERIERQFGSYGIEVLASDGGVRRSRLYSIHDGQHICRTYALVRFTDTPDPGYRKAHDEVLAGGSLGAVFKKHGWTISKQTLHIGTFALLRTATEIDELMYLEHDQAIALHVYRLVLSKDQQNFDYATIAEAHHPDYLSETDLHDIYDVDDAAALSDAQLAEVIGLLNHKSVN